MSRLSLAQERVLAAAADCTLYWDARAASPCYRIEGYGKVATVTVEALQLRGFLRGTTITTEGLGALGVEQ